MLLKRGLFHLFMNVILEPAQNVVWVSGKLLKSTYFLQPPEMLSKNTLLSSGMELLWGPFVCLSIRWSVCGKFSTKLIVHLRLFLLK